MLTTILEEVINGYIVTSYLNSIKTSFVYEKYNDAKDYRDKLELKYITKQLSDYHEIA